MIQANQLAANIPSWVKTVFRWLMMYLVLQVITRYAMPYLMPTSTLAPDGINDNSTVLQPPPGKDWPHRCAFKSGDRLTLFMFLTYNNAEWNETTSQLVWKESGLTYDWADHNTRELNITVPVDERLLSNQTVTAHLFLVKGNNKIKPPTKRSSTQAHLAYNLTVWGQKKKAKNLHSLIGTIEEANETNTTMTVEQEEIRPWLMYWKPAMEMRMLGDAMNSPPGSLPDMIRVRVPVDFDVEVFWPILYVNEFWAKHESRLIVNSTLTELPLSLHYSPIGLMKLTMYIQTEASMKAQAALSGVGSGGVVEEEMDEFRRILTETNPLLLVLTMVVTMVHSVLDFMAFKNDVSFWRSRKSVAGLSVKTLMLNCFMQLVIFLYLLDNETSWLILISSGIGVLIEFWKISRASKVSLVWKWQYIPWIKLTDKDSYVKSQTKVHDETAMRYLSYVLYPLLVGYAIYSLIFESHKSWYSWVLGSLTGAVYTFGFIAMCPQLFINYKLKSVAHLPWRALIYKSLNTVIDDLFAFIIKMPTLHRIACFRDDIVFAIYLYQRWIYRVDPTRQESANWEDAADDFAEQKAVSAVATPSVTPAEHTTPETKKDQ